ADAVPGVEAGHLVGVLVDVPAIRRADEVPAVDVVGVALAVVIAAVAGDLVLVDPEVGAQVVVRRVDPGVDDADHDGPPRLLVRQQLAVRPLDAGAVDAVAAGILQPPAVGRRGRGVRRAGGPGGRVVACGPGLRRGGLRGARGPFRCDAGRSSPGPGGWAGADPDEGGEEQQGQWPHEASLQRQGQGRTSTARATRGGGNTCTGQGGAGAIPGRPRAAAAPWAAAPTTCARGGGAVFPAPGPRPERSLRGRSAAVVPGLDGKLCR